MLSAVPDCRGQERAADARRHPPGQRRVVLQRHRRRWGARAASAVVLDPRTGEVLAMASEPGFDANRFPETDRDTQRNRAVTDTYEPGSTLKVVTVAAALSEGLVTPSSAFRLPPQHPRRRPRDPRGTPDVDRAHDGRGDPLPLVQRRDDHARGAARPQPARALDRAVRLRASKTASTSPARQPGSCPSTGRARRSARSRSGTGIAVTPVQMAAAYAAVANGGVWLRPRLLADRGLRSGGA